MQAQDGSTLDVIYESWRGYQEKLRECVAPLTAAQLALQPAPHLWPLGQLVQHIISVRAGWFSGTMQEADPAMDAYMYWGQRESPPRSGAELAQGLDDTWAFIQRRRSARSASRMNGTVRCTNCRAVGSSITSWNTTSITAAKFR
jgi:Protein of unknown function (DUF664)